MMNIFYKHVNPLDSFAVNSFSHPTDPEVGRMFIEKHCYNDLRPIQGQMFAAINVSCKDVNS